MRLKISHRFILCLMMLLAGSNINAQDITISVNASGEKKPISPYIYGRNNSFGDVYGSSNASTAINLFKEAGLKMARENGGNNATKYNWRKKITSHPDWYNNVYDRNWDGISQLVENQAPGTQVMWAFQLLGKVASTKNNNFNDWAYNQSKWWEGCNQNLAGGGVANSSGGTKASNEGNPALYTEVWPADSTTAILNRWFGQGGLGLKKENFRYWNMDNEPDIWSGTHDDVMPTQISADGFMTKYFEVAKKARSLFPGIKLCGPVVTNEWQWYKYGSETLKINGRYYSWLEYFIKRVADEEKATGIRLLDVLDIHWYPGESSDAEVVQLHRIFYDKNYVYPGANGIKTINGGWDTSQTKEYIFNRIESWLNTHFGTNHGIGLGLSESGINSSNPNVNAVLYASMLGTFANNGVELFTPWSWKTGMWETLHLFSRYSQPYNIPAASTNENTLSGYASISVDNDSMTVMIVNRDLTVSKTVKVNLNGFTARNGSHATLQLSALPGSETFISHTQNNLNKSTVTVNNNSFTITVPKLSTTAVLVTSATTSDQVITYPDNAPILYPNPASDVVNIRFPTVCRSNSQARIFTPEGKLIHSEELPTNGLDQIQLYTNHLTDGLYFLKIDYGETTNYNYFCIKKR